MVNKITKKITGAENIVCDYFGYNTVAFLADLPKNVIITKVVVTGKENYETFVTNLESPYDLASSVHVKFYPDADYDGKTVVAILHSEFDGNRIVDAARAFQIEEFSVDYIRTAIVEE
jgi:hypothetical protein